MISIYKEKLFKSEKEYKKLSKKYNTIGFLRLLIVVSLLLLLYFCFQKPYMVYFVGIFLSVVTFLYLISLHKKVSFLRRIEKSKIEINQKEIDFLEKGIHFSDNGSVFQNQTHPYAFDLDIFGEKSLYHHINRASSYLGKKCLADSFLEVENPRIEENQKAIAELSEKLDWRQYFSALMMQVSDSADFYQKIDDWTTKKIDDFPIFLKYFMKISPVAFFLCLILGFLFNIPQFETWAITIFLVNLTVLGLFLNKMLQNKLGFEGTYEILDAFKKSINSIEKEHFESEKLRNVQQKFFQNNKSASKNIQKLSNLLDNVDNVSNIFSFLLNGATLYHLHIYNELILWKKEHVSNVKEWLKTVGEVEALISLSNFKYNNPKYVFPELNSDLFISFEEMAHPLIPEKKRVANSVSLHRGAFLILTGSNMSGKSTFLRTLGVNMLLTTMGMPVCARKANVHPLNVLVSMRLSDSLNDGKSYFFAEIHRIQKIIQTVENQYGFVLLDELLRGTNSQDKQLGTIKIIEKMISYKAIGIIATHDLEVCQLSEKYPQNIQNKCFESIIEGDTLYFDYKLKDGICQNKNATFLMKKLGIID